jgi:hypothetical protein
MNATLITFIWFRKSNKDFSYTIFPVKKNKCWKNLKLWENCYLIILSIHILKLEISGCDNRRMNRLVYLSKRRFIQCWSSWLCASQYDLNVTVGWTDGQGVGSSDAYALSLDPYCSQTLRCRMNRCMYRRFIRRRILNPVATELIRRI